MERVDYRRQGINVIDLREDAVLLQAARVAAVAGGLMTARPQGQHQGGHHTYNGSQQAFSSCKNSILNS